MSDQAAIKLEKFNHAFSKALQESAEASGAGLGQALRDNYYFDAVRWPDKAARNIAKHKAIQSLCLPEKHNIEVTTQCILKCDFCVLHSGALLKKRSKAFMGFADFQQLFFQIEPYLSHIEFTGGEPLLNRDLLRMVALCNSYSIKTTIATNAQLLNDNRIEEVLDAPPSVLLVAYEGGHANSYRAHRKGGNFQRLTDNLARLIERKKQRRQSYPRIQLQTVVSRKTVSQLDHFWEDAENSGVDSACIKPIFIWPDGTEDYQRLMINEYLIPGHPLSYHTISPTGELEPTGVPDYCPNTKTVHIGTGGEVVPCWYNLLTSPSMGKVTERHFFDIWFSEDYQEFRQKMASHTAYEHKCRHCIGIYKPELFVSRTFRPNLHELN